MFFLIAGVQPRTRTIDDTSHRCPTCGRNTAKLKRVDHYFSLFFIPLFPVKKGEEVLLCENCGYSSSPEGDNYFAAPERFGERAAREERGICPECGRAVEPGFSYCPYCGARL
ncbi:MAG: zinc ribbon domain-containing protein [Spirochaetia bacterium]